MAPTRRSSWLRPRTRTSIKTSAGDHTSCSSNNNTTNTMDLHREASDNLTSSSHTMLPPSFTSGINYRKSKSSAETNPRNNCTLSQACSDSKDYDSYDDERKPVTRSILLFWLRKRHFGQMTYLIIVVVFCLVVSVALTYCNGISSSVLLESPQVKFSTWGEHPRVTFLEEAKHRYESSSGLPEMKHSVPAMAPTKFFQHLEDSESYDDNREDQFETETCKAQYEWQLHSFPSCNHFHEREMASQLLRQYRAMLSNEELHSSSNLDIIDENNLFRHVGNGYWRDVWLLPSSRFDSHQVLKTMRYEHEYTPRNFDRHRRDALAMERLSSHPFVIDIYAFCGNSGVFEFAPGGDITDAIWPRGEFRKRRIRDIELPKMERLRIGVQAAIGLAAFHNFDQEGRPSVAHTDIGPTQFVRVGDIYKLNDFNRCRFMRKNVHDGSVCPFQVGHNPGKNRAPEEYAYADETEKVDVFSLGNIFYLLLMNRYPFHGVSEKVARKALKKGKRAILYEDIANSTDPIDVALRTAMYMSHVQSPEERSSAREIETYLKQRLEELDPGRVDAWFKSAAEQSTGA